MRAVTLAPGKAGSQRLDEVPEPPEKPGSILVRALAVGVCGTDRELVDGLYGEAAPGRERLVLGHESLGRVISAPPDSDFAIGDMVVGMVARPDPVPCVNCAVGEWDMCRNGLYTERGIKQADGFCAERWRSDPGFAIKVTPVLGLAAVLLEPASVLAKAWEHIERIGRRARWAPERVVITGAGPVGLMAALMGVQRGLEVHVMDRNEAGPKPALVRELGAACHSEFPAIEPDIVIECTGSPPVIPPAGPRNPARSIVRLTGARLGRDGSIDWLCWPRFDSAACFAALLGTREHGRWQIAPLAEYRATRRYRADSLILETDFETAEGAVTLIDFMPTRDEHCNLVRL